MWKRQEHWVRGKPVSGEKDRSGGKKFKVLLTTQNKQYLWYVFYFWVHWLVTYLIQQVLESITARAFVSLSPGLGRWNTACPSRPPAIVTASRNTACPSGPPAIVTASRVLLVLYLLMLQASHLPGHYQLNNQFDNFLWIDWLDNFARMHTLFQGGLHRQGEVCLGSWTKTWFWSKSWLTLPAHPWSSIPSPKPKAQALSTFLDHIYEEILWEGKNKQE